MGWKPCPYVVEPLSLWGGCIVLMMPKPCRYVAESLSLWGIQSFVSNLFKRNFHHRALLVISQNVTFT